MHICPCDVKLLCFRFPKYTVVYISFVWKYTLFLIKNLLFMQKSSSAHPRSYFLFGLLCYLRVFSFFPLEGCNFSSFNCCQSIWTGELAVYDIDQDIIFLYGTWIGRSNSKFLFIKVAKNEMIKISTSSLLNLCSWGILKVQNGVHTCFRGR